MVSRFSIRGGVTRNPLVAGFSFARAGLLSGVVRKFHRGPYARDIRDFRVGPIGGVAAMVRVGLILGVGIGLVGRDPTNRYKRFIWFSFDSFVSRGIL